MKAKVVYDHCMMYELIPDDFPGDCEIKLSQEEKDWIEEVTVKFTIVQDFLERKVKESETEKS